MNEQYYQTVGNILKSILPNNWDSAVFSLLVRDCSVNGKKAISKEFQCKCIKRELKQIIDLVSNSEGNYEVEDILFKMMDEFYEFYNKSSGWNFIIFKLNSDGSYQTKFFDKIDNSFDAKIISNTVDKFLIYHE